ncbi:alpha/beta fold hydrolase [Halobacillus sp. ACCC02827]|uniref:alpha/beta hydrolase family protein n=1 Tax=Halobacillus sp. ACCC02827 TaxID=3052090 RepID=UPI00256FFA62|nr:alpha/beta fold hydrolase [Halobacillus sp. ACCC02827]WJE15122.1 alpha/beta fold hydrolase [Halobacillus sp. ACCC02827]
MEQKTQANAGFQKIEVEEDHLGVSYPLYLFYPTETEEKEEHLGPYQMSIAKGADPRKGSSPLVVLSHGTGGTPLVYRTLGRYLARHGFFVAMPVHPFNNKDDNRLENTQENLISRPMHITQTIDRLLTDDQLREYVDAGDISIIGHSMGGYTAVAAAGGVPATLPWETDDGNPETIAVEVERRIRRMILLAPALGWFRSAGALDRVDVPILVMTGEKDDITPSFHADILLQGVPHPERVEHQVIEQAGHFSFLSPFPDVIKHPDFPPSQDPEGFDRRQFQMRLQEEVLEFLRKKG